MPWLAWLGFAALSILWSTLPADVTSGAFAPISSYPFVLFLASFMLVRSRGGCLALTIGAGAGTLMSLATTIAATIAPIDPKADAPVPGILGWLAWKAGEHRGSEHLCRLCHGALVPGPADLGARRSIAPRLRSGWRRSPRSAS